MNSESPSSRINRLIQTRLAGSLLLACGYLWILKTALPEGINQSFAKALFLPACVAAAVVLLVSISLSRQRPLRFSGRFPTGDLLLLGLPLTPVAQYVLLNQQTMTVLDTVIVIAGGFLLLILTVLIIPWLVRRWIHFSASMLMFLALSYVLLNMAAMARANHWHQTGDLLSQLLLLAGVLLVCCLIYRSDGRALRVVSICFFATTVLHTFWENGSRQLATGAEIARHDTAQSQRYDWLEEFSGEKARRKPHIFLMTYDSYVENETLLQYGIDNSAQERYLEETGFQLYPGVYSVASTSRDSMSRVLGSTSALRGVAGFSPVSETLRTNGYVTIGIFKNDYFFNGVGVGYDRSFPPPSRPFFSIAAAIAEGQFRHNASFSGVSHSEFVRRKRQAIVEPASAPKFLYSHTGPGHSQNSGKCRPDETELFRQRLEAANAEMRADVSTIIKMHPEALIVINGDHGPHLTKNCTTLSPGAYSVEDISRLDIQDRFGTFLAIRWPRTDSAVPEQSFKVLQDLFPRVFTFLFERPVPAERLLEPAIRSTWSEVIGGVSVDDGVIVGGPYDSEPLFRSSRRVQR